MDRFSSIEKLNDISILFAFFGILEIGITIRMLRTNYRQKKLVPLKYIKKINFSFIALMMIIIGYMLLNTKSELLMTLPVVFVCTSIFMLYIDYDAPYIVKGGLLYYGQLVHWDRITSYSVEENRFIFFIKSKKIVLECKADEIDHAKNILSKYLQ